MLWIYIINRKEPLLHVFFVHGYTSRCSLCLLLEARAPTPAPELNYSALET